VSSVDAWPVQTLQPGTAAYGEATGCFNATIHHDPAAVLAPNTEAEVALAVRTAAARGLRVAVQATGHGAAADASTVLVSTQRLDRVAVDPAARTATVGAGVRWRDTLAAAATHGLAGVAGSTPGVGVVGYTVTGGVGLLSRTFGFAADRVRSLRLVTADGDVRTVDATQEADLFWALRGGGGLGLVTSLTFDLVEVPTVVAGSLYYDLTDAPTVLHRWADWARTAPPTVNTSVAVLALPPHERIPAPIRGRRVLHVRYADAGSTADRAEERAEESRARIAAFGRPVLGEVRTIPYQESGWIHAEPTEPSATSQDSLLLGSLPDEAVDAFLTATVHSATALSGTGLTVCELRAMGGAMGTPAEVPNAAPGRSAAFNLYALGHLAVAGDALEDALDAVLTAMAPWGLGATLPAFAGRGRGTDRVLAAWSPGDLARLREIRTAYDPDDLFGPCVRWPAR